MNIFYLKFSTFNVSESISYLGKILALFLYVFKSQGELRATEPINFCFAVVVCMRYM